MLSKNVFGEKSMYYADGCVDNSNSNPETVKLLVEVQPFIPYSSVHNSPKYTKDHLVFDSPKLWRVT